MITTWLLVVGVVVLPLPAMTLGVRGVGRRRGLRAEDRTSFALLVAARLLVLLLVLALSGVVLLSAIGALVRHLDLPALVYTFFVLDLLRLYREMDDRDEEPVVIYHSHTATEARPSRTDVSLASEPGAHYVLVSTRDPEAVEFRSFRIVDGEVTEEPVEIVAPESS